MSFNVLEATKGLITNELITNAGYYLHESEKGIALALEAIIPSVISGLANNAITCKVSIAAVNLASEVHNGDIRKNFGNFFSNERGPILHRDTEIVTDLFGESKVNQFIKLIAGFSGIKNSSAVSLTNLAAQMILVQIGKHVSSNYLNKNGVASLLTEQREAVLKAIPLGFNAGSFSNISLPTKNLIHSNDSQINVAEEAKNNLKWLLSLLFLAGIAILAWYLVG